MKCYREYRILNKEPQNDEVFTSKFDIRYSLFDIPRFIKVFFHTFPYERGKPAQVLPFAKGRQRGFSVTAV
jgi:hypothetical protein